MLQSVNKLFWGIIDVYRQNHMKHTNT